MSIQIAVKAAGLNLTANLKDDALAAVITLIQSNRDDSVAQPVAPSTLTPALSGSIAEVPTITGDEASVKAFIKDRGAAEILNQLRWESYPQKILLLGAWYEATGGTAPWRSSDMDSIFSQAKEKPPGNFPREIRATIKSGWVHAITPRTYTITRTGWNTIAEAIGKLQP